MYKIVRHDSRETEILKNPIDQTVKVFNNYYEAKHLAEKLNSYTKDNLLWKVISY